MDFLFCIQKFFLFALVFVLTQVQAAIENISRGKNATQSGMNINPNNGSSNYAVDGDYKSDDLRLCATPVSFRSKIWWLVDLGNVYMIASVVVYSSSILPESTFLSSISVYVLESFSPFSVSRPIASSNGRVPPGGSSSFHFESIPIGKSVRVERSSFATSFGTPLPNLSLIYMALCEVDVFGSIVNTSNPEVVSVGRKATQSNTYQGRHANLALDGNFGTSSLEQCATAYSINFSLPAWWRIDLGDLFLIESVTIALPLASQDMRFLMHQEFEIIVSVDPDLNCKSRCFSGNYYSRPQKNNTREYDCSKLWSISRSIGRYVTIRKLSGLYRYVMTLCEVTVNGIRQPVSSLDSALDFCKSSNTEDEGKDALRSIAPILSLVAIAVGGAALLLGVICFILLIVYTCKFKKGPKKSERPPTTPRQRPNSYAPAYDDTAVAKVTASRFNMNSASEYDDI